MKEKTDIKSMNLEELTEFVTGMGEKRFRAKQLYAWMHRKLSDSFEEMSDLSGTFRERLKEECSHTLLRQVDVQVSGQDGTRKYLFLLEDGNVIESVLAQAR